MGGCGGDCACAGSDKKGVAACSADEKKVVLDEHGKCPCGKTAESCCHKDAIQASTNEALGELCCGSHGPDVC
ncbi:MAG: hypothetical protein A2845_02710 [Candidatus Lloydbacteria bacterium RIFCSPHIGHO2_01_FULL_49_22]|uniref:Uncharacterized protein n=1 Tax=Candidatus Lloydbacteria bacterium RIFCSPHIGHO2_01_FULL_49_22 TaxID=1798658 RepID=A0A1G2CVC0_9BACT|nr:MAG: hypothetical protein A2845_02710 [Candidatus Lloydbacteria bacterium RIFCSPHIGHO2_01_FULL_49_22]OGZ10359.1 MAG: hypothetical protein A3C14_02410 [Candidatus Lloydbacteria bacterium RIFCSPHIGHO2_02_FULL_50_18]